MQNNVNLAPGCSTSGQHKCEACTSQFTQKEDLIVHQLLFHSYSTPKINDNDGSMTIQRRPVHPAEVRSANHPSSFQSPGLSNYSSPWGHNTRTYPTTSVRSPNLPYSPHNFGFGNRERQVQATVNLVHGSQGSGQYKCERCGCQFQVREDLVVHQLLCHNAVPNPQFQRPVESPRIPTNVENLPLPSRHPVSDVSMGYRERNPYYYGSGFAYVHGNFAKDSYGTITSNMGPVMAPTHTHAQSDFAGRSNVSPVTAHSLTPLEHSIPEYSTGNNSMSHPPEALDLSYSESGFSKDTDGAGRSNMIPVTGPGLPYPERSFSRGGEGIERSSMSSAGGKGFGLTYVQDNITDNAERAARSNVSPVTQSHLMNEQRGMSVGSNVRHEKEQEQERQVNHPNLHMLSGHSSRIIPNHSNHLMSSHIHNILTSERSQLITNHLQETSAITSKSSSRSIIKPSSSTTVTQDNTNRNESNRLISHQKGQERNHLIPPQEPQERNAIIEQRISLQKNTVCNESSRPITHQDYQETRVNIAQASSVNKASSSSTIPPENSKVNNAHSHIIEKQTSQESSARIAQNISGHTKCMPTSSASVPQGSSNTKTNTAPEKRPPDLQQKPHLQQQKQPDTAGKKTEVPGQTTNKNVSKTVNQNVKFSTDKIIHKISVEKVKVSTKEESLNLAKGEGTGQHKCVRCGSGFHVKADLDMHLLVFHSLKKPHREPLKEKPKESTPAEREKINRTTMKRTVDDILRMLPNKRRTGGVKGEVKVVSVSYRCQTCDISFLTLAGLEEHQYVNHKCRTCEFTFDNKEQLQRHKIIAHMCGMCGHYFQRNESRKTHPCEDNICTICGERVESKDKLQEHNAENHKCSGCRATFLYKADLDKHRLNKHGHRCSICGYHFKWKEGLKQHILSTHGLKCVTCKARFTTKEELEKHIMENHKCDICSLFFKTAETLQKHKNFIHICSVCGVIFKERDKLTKHQYEEHKCSLCNEQFKVQKDLESHRRSIHKCCFCDVVFDSKQEQDTHPCETYKCPCGANYETEDELENHSKDNHFCPFCDIFFLMREEFVNHRSTNHRCIICKAQYVLKANLDKHKENEHKCKKCGSNPVFENKKDPSLCECGESFKQSENKECQPSTVQIAGSCETHTNKEPDGQSKMDKLPMRTDSNSDGSKPNKGNKSDVPSNTKSDSPSKTDKSEDNSCMTSDSKPSLIPTVVVRGESQDITGDETNSCKHCQASFCDTKTLKEHEASCASTHPASNPLPPPPQESTKAAEMSFSCHLCKKQLESHAELTNHLRESHQSIAKDCESNLPKGKQKDHGNNGEGSTRTSARKKVNRVFKCRYCHWHFNNFARFKRHTTRHEKSYRSFWYATHEGKGKEQSGSN